MAGSNEERTREEEADEQPLEAEVAVEEDESTVFDEPERKDWAPHKRASTRTVNRELRRQRSQAKQSRRRLLIGIGGGTIAAALIMGLVLPSLGNLSFGGNSGGTVNTPDTPIAAIVGTELPIQDGGIIEAGAEHAAYTSSPPASGPRYGDPAEWGLYADQLPDETVLRNLEQGGVAINYQLSDPSDIALLLDFARSLPGFPGCYIVQPHGEVAVDTIIVTSWGWTQTLSGVDRSGMDQFVAFHRNQAPLFLGNTCGADAEQAG